MSIFYPSIKLKRVYDITPEQLMAWGIKAIFLDVDNTLTTHNNPNPDENITDWLERMKSSGFTLAIASNNSDERIKPFAHGLTLDYAARSKKPLPTGFNQLAARLNLAPEQCVVVGDQIFTDILGGNLFGAKTVLVEPMLMEDHILFKLKRKLEIPILNAYNRKVSKGKNV